MKKVHVSLAYVASDFGTRRSAQAGLALPVRVLDAEGSVLAEGAASVDGPITLEVPDDTTLSFVRLTWPSGRTETQRVNFQGTPEAGVVFSDTRIAPNEWSAWAVPKLNPNTRLVAGSVDLGLDRFDKVWLRLWKRENGAWTRERLQPDQTYRNGAAWQLDITLTEAPWMLQVGGSQVTWRFVSLPGGGKARVLLTPKDSIDPRADALKVVVTSFRADAETLLEFLARDAMRAVKTLAESNALATQLFADKLDDPVSAVAGAYYLLRQDAWDRVPLSWFKYLSEAFEWLPDAAIVHCIRMLRDPDARPTGPGPHDLFMLALARGWPVYAEGVALLQEAAQSLRGQGTDNSAPFDAVQALGGAKAWAGAAASFYGRDPDAPSAVQWVGMPHAPRRRRLDPLLAAVTSPQARPSAAENRSSQRVAGDDQDGEFLLGSITR